MVGGGGGGGGGARNGNALFRENQMAKGENLNLFKPLVVLAENMITRDGISAIWPFS